jgi:hypothetical protein
VYVSDLSNGTPIPICVYGVATDTWTEGGITWNSQPTAGTTSVACKSVTVTGWATWDVTSLVKAQAAGDGVVSLVLKDNAKSDKLARLDSRESSNVPVIVVD